MDILIYFSLTIFSNLSHNHLVALMDDTFSHLNLLKFLYLDNNRISYIGERAFSGLASLQTLWVDKFDVTFHL